MFLFTWFYDTLIKPIINWLIAAAAVAAAIAWFYFKGQSVGRASEKQKLQDATNKIEKQWNEVDSSSVDFDAAIDGLRRRADRD